MVPFAVVLAFAKARPNVAVETFEGDQFEVYPSPARERAADLAVAISP